MTDQQILDALTRILRSLLGSESLILTLETRRSDVHGWDSFNYVNFIVGVEIEFALRFRVADIESFETVGDIVNEIKAIKAW
jgi:acyl carrier protein